MEGMIRSGEFASGCVCCPRTIGAYGGWCVIMLMLVLEASQSASPQL